MRKKSISSDNMKSAFILKISLILYLLYSDFVTNFFNESLGLIWEKVVGPRPNSMSRQSESPP